MELEQGLSYPTVGVDLDEWEKLKRIPHHPASVSKTADTPFRR